MFNWFKKSTTELIEEKDNMLVRFSKKATDYIDIIVSRSTHKNRLTVISEAISVASIIYKEAEKHPDGVVCKVENGKIVIYVDDDDDGGGEPIPVLVEDNTVQLFRKAA
jgi:hypothetical protein